MPSIATLGTYNLFFVWLLFCCVAAYWDAIFFLAKFMLTLSWDPRLEGCWLPVTLLHIVFLDRRDLVAAMSRYIKKRLYGGVGKIGWGYYKDLPAGKCPNEHSFDRKLEMVPLNDGATVLDVGCGYGWFASALAAKLPKSTIYGLEVDPKCIETAKAKNAAGNVHYAVFKESFVEALPASIKGSVDAVYLIGVANEVSIEQLRGLLEDAHGQLKPSGKIYLGFVDRTAQHWDGLAMAFAHYLVPTFQHEAPLLQLCAELGFKVDTLLDNTPYSCIPHFQGNRSKSWTLFGPFLGACYWILLTRWLNFVGQGNLRSYNLVLHKPLA